MRKCQQLPLKVGYYVCHVGENAVFVSAVVYIST